MEPDTAIARARALAEHFESPDRNTTWVHFLGKLDWVWATELLGQLVALIGDQEVLYASGHVVDDGVGPVARVAVFLPGSVIDGGYGPREPGGPSRAWTRAVGWGSIAAVRVEEIGSLVTTQSEWPTKLRIQVEFVGIRPSLHLPVGSNPPSDGESLRTLAAFLPRLVAGIGG